MADQEFLDSSTGHPPHPPPRVAWTGGYPEAIGRQWSDSDRHPRPDIGKAGLLCEHVYSTHVASRALDMPLQAPDRKDDTACSLLTTTPATFLCNLPGRQTALLSSHFRLRG